MNYKIEGAIRRSKKSFIICAILWLLLVIVFVAPMSYSAFQASQSGNQQIEVFMEKILENTTHPFSTFVGIFANGAVHNFVSLLLVFTIFYLVIFFIGFTKSAPKNRYSDVEHGSSDWSERGEQYQILSRNKGIILAENNYLPIDKRGNVNVLVVGRFRFW